MVKIVADTTLNVPSEIAEQLGIHVIPLKVLFGNETFLDVVELSPTEFYQRLATCKELPTTSQPSAGEFYDLYSRLVQDGSEVISIHISSLLSGTIASAKAGREMLSDPSLVHIVDSRLVSIAAGMFAIAAAEAAQAGQTCVQILRRLDQMVDSALLFFIVDTLEYLQKGGRIGGAAALLGMALSIKPLLFFENGRIEPLEKIRTKKKAVRRMIELMVEQVGADTPVWAAIPYTNVPEEAQELAEQVRARLNCVRLYIAEAGPVLGTHGGPGCLGLATIPVSALEWT